MGLSILAHGAIVVGVGYLGLQSLREKGESVSEMEFGANPADAPTEAVVPLDMPAPAEPPTPEVPAPVMTPPPRPTPVAKPELPQPAPTTPVPPENVPSPVVVPPAAEPAPEEEVATEPPSTPAVAAAPVTAPPEVAEPLPDSSEPTEQAPEPQTEQTPVPVSTKAQKAIPETGEGVAPQTESGQDQISSAETPGIPEGVISDSQLSPLQMARPEYPMTEKMKGNQGDVILLYSLRGDGSVGNIRVFKSSGFKNLDLSAAKALSQYKYPTGRTAEVIKTFSFRLKGPSVEAPSRWRK